MRVGLIVLNWNGREVLPLCLSSLDRAAAASRHEMRLLVVDNASTDGSAEIARSEHSNWELLVLAENLGFAAGMNRGLERLAESADYLCVLNNDIEADPGFIDPLIDDLEGEAQRGAASPRIHYHAARDLIWYAGGHVGRLTRVAWHRGIRRRAEGRWLEAADTGYLTGCCIMGRSEFWRMTQGFDPIFGMYAEDVDLSLRAQALGWKLRYQPDSLIYHRIGHSSGGGLGPAKLRAQQRAVRRLIQRHVRPAARPLAYLAWALRTFHAAVAALARGERGVFAALLRSVGPGPGAKS